ncbi:hypothetical protein Ancab_032627 [Ancistrocladus abbreviatus]
MGPSVRSLWKASKDKIAMEEILVVGQNSAVLHTAVLGMTVRSMGNGHNVQQQLIDIENDLNAFGTLVEIKGDDTFIAQSNREVFLQIWAPIPVVSKTILVINSLKLQLSGTRGGLRNRDYIEKLFSENKFDTVIHFAGLKAVGESVAYPLHYFDYNLIGLIKLYQTMVKHNCKMLVFSSSATVYGQPEKVLCVEDFELKATNPYGRTKLFLEEIARDISNADAEWRIILLRYFNPVATHETG